MSHKKINSFLLNALRNYFSRGQIGNIVGFTMLAFFMAFIPLFFPISRLLNIAWVPIYLIVAICAKRTWDHPLAPKLPSNWFAYALYSVGIAVVFLIFSRIAAFFAFGHNETDASRIFDYGLILFIAPGGTIIAIIGGVRLLVHRFMNRAE